MLLPSWAEESYQYAYIAYVYIVSLFLFSLILFSRVHVLPMQVEYATVLSKLGVGVSLLCTDDEFLPFLESEIRESLKRRMRRNHVLFVPEAIKGIEIDPVNASFVKVSLQAPKPKISVNAVIPTPSATSIASTVFGAVASILTPPSQETVTATATATTTEGEARPGLKRVERQLKVDMVLCSTGRDANSEGLGLDKVHCNIGQYGRIQIDSNQKTTATSEIYAVGDVIGPPGTATIHINMPNS